MEVWQFSSVPLSRVWDCYDTYKPPSSFHRDTSFNPLMLPQKAADDAAVAHQTHLRAETFRHMNEHFVGPSLPIWRDPFRIYFTFWQVYAVLWLCRHRMKILKKKQKSQFKNDARGTAKAAESCHSLALSTKHFMAYIEADIYEMSNCIHINDRF